MIRSCIIFACTIFSESRLFVLQEFLNSFKSNFSDSDFYVGINFGCIPEVEKLIRESKLNIISLEHVQQHQYSESDAAAYQAALSGLKKSNKEYDNYWLIHTKGSVNSHSDYLRKWYIDNFISKRQEIEEFIKQNKYIGSYGKLGLEFGKEKNYEDTDCQLPLFNNLITPDFPCTHANFFYIHTLYIITNKPMKKFLSLVSEEWFNSKLDRYYFEGVFHFISSRSGYFPYLENRISATGIDLSVGLKEWILENNLKDYEDLLYTYKTDFPFLQLRPPYVNSDTQP